MKQITKMNPKVILVIDKTLTCKVCKKTFTNMDIAAAHIHNNIGTK